MRGNVESSFQVGAAAQPLARGERKVALEVERLAERLGLIDLSISLHLLQTPRAAPDRAKAFAAAAAGAAGQCFELAPTAFALLFLGRDDAAEALERRVCEMLAEPAGREVGGVAALRSLACRSHDVVRGEWLLGDLRRASARILRAD